jgi:hypothetical protein
MSRSEQQAKRNDSEISFSMVGEDINGGTVTQSVTGGNLATVTMTTPVSEITTFTRSGMSSGKIMVGYEPATCDVLD